MLICQVSLPDIKEINLPSLNTTPGSFERLPFLDVGLLSSSPQPVSPAASFNRFFQIRTDNPCRLTCFLQCSLLTSECCYPICRHSWAAQQSRAGTRGVCYTCIGMHPGKDSFSVARKNDMGEEIPKYYCQRVLSTRTRNCLWD